MIDQSSFVDSIVVAFVDEQFFILFRHFVLSVS